MGVYVAFDIGNVLCTFDIHKYVKYLAYQLDITEDKSMSFLEQLQKAQDIGSTNMLLSLMDKFSLNRERATELVDEWNRNVQPHDLMLRFLENIMDEGVHIAYLSNMGQEHIQYLRTKWPQMFNKVVQHISCEVGARKPTKLFFQSFVLDHDEYKGAVYVDDLEDNLRSGKFYSFKVYQFQLDKVLKESQSKQKLEIDKLKRMVFDKMW